jgi:hypothetical protein
MGPTVSLRQSILLGLFLVSCAGVWGCGRGDGFGAVSGSVTFQGKPLEEGTIQFYTPDEPPTLAGGAAIVAGKFELPREHGLKPGSYLVRISSTERTEIPAKGGIAMPGFRTRERIPAKYNTESTLKADIAQPGPLQFSLD